MKQHDHEQVSHSPCLTGSHAKFESFLPTAKETPEVAPDLSSGLHLASPTHTYTCQHKVSLGLSNAATLKEKEAYREGSFTFLEDVPPTLGAHWRGDGGQEWSSSGPQCTSLTPAGLPAQVPGN